MSVQTALERWRDDLGFQGQQAKPPATHTFPFSGNVRVTWHSAHVLYKPGNHENSSFITWATHSTQVNLIKLDNLYNWAQRSWDELRREIPQEKLICVFSIFAYV